MITPTQYSDTAFQSDSEEHHDVHTWSDGAHPNVEAILKAYKAYPKIILDRLELVHGSFDMDMVRTNDNNHYPDLQKVIQVLLHSLENSMFTLEMDRLKRHGWNSIADSLDYLYRLPPEPGENQIVLKSVQAFVRFVTTNPDLPLPNISIDPNGFVNASWWSKYAGSLTMDFLPSEKIVFAAILYMYDDQKQHLSGMQTHEDTMNTLRQFFNCLVSK